MESLMPTILAPCSSFSYCSPTRHLCIPLLCCFLPFCSSPYHSRDPYQEEKETAMESLMSTLRLLFRLLFVTTYCLLRYCKDVQFARVILLHTRFVIVQDIQVKKLIAKFVLSKYFIIISIVIVKEWLLYFSLRLIGRGGILHRTFLYTSFLG